MLLPFGEQLDNIFRRGPANWRKVLAGASVAAMIGWPTVVQMDGFNFAEGTALLLFTGLLGAGSVVLLSLRDRVHHRVEAKQQVHWLLRMYFGCGIVSLMVWIVTIIVVILPAMVAVFEFLNL